MVDYPHTKYDYSGFALTDVSNVVVKVYPSAEDRNYSNSRVHGQGRLDGHTVPLSELVKLKYDLNYDWKYDLNCDYELWLDLNQLNCGNDMKKLGSY